MTTNINKKRIAMISTHGYVAAKPPLGAPDTGGQVVFVLELSRILAKSGWNVDIYTRLFEDLPENETAGEGVRIIRIPCGGNSFIPKEYLPHHIDEWADNAAAYIEESGLSYEFINSHYWDAGKAGMILSDKLGINHIHTPHSLGVWKKSNMEKDFPEDADAFEKKYNFTERISTESDIYRTASGVIATTPVQQELLVNEYSVKPELVAMIPPGYDDSKFFPVGDATRNMIRQRLDFPENSILALSRLAHNKGLDLLVDGFALLLRQFDGAHLFLAVGHEDRNSTEDAIYTDLLERARRYGISDYITFTGYISDEELPDYYRAADAFVLSSRYEPFGMTAIEAMACGTPAIVTPHGGLSTVLNDGVNAMIADPFSPEELAADMAAILRHDGLSRQLAEQGGQLARECFSWTEIAGQLSAFAAKNGTDSRASCTAG